jgi:hypothetical protein
MNGFTSYKNLLTELLASIISSPELHSRWLNTLSYLENCGARKIAACEHPTLVKEEMLKHAAEEFRHAHYLKRQIEKINPASSPNYSLSFLLGGISSLHYLNAVDAATSRYLSRTCTMTKSAMREASYLLVTYAIELRALELYPLYDDALKIAGTKVQVKSILLEEKGHLQEIEDELKRSPYMAYAEQICTIESKLCLRWLQAVKTQLTDY